MDYQAVLEEVAAHVRPQIGRGRVAQDIPALASVDADRFGIALADVDGRVTGVGDWERPFSSTTMLDFLRAESGNPDLAFDQEVAASETAHGDRNAALAHFMAGYGNLDNPVPTVLEHYFWQCSIEMIPQLPLGGSL